MEKPDPLRIPHLYGLLLVAIIGVVISIFYYFGWIRSAYFETPSVGAEPARPALATPSWLGVLTLALLGVATLVLGFYQQPLTSWLLR